jgi:hypothetical protein
MNLHRRGVIGFLAILLPPYLIELTTEFLYLTPGTDYYFFFSSLRLYFFIAYLGIASFLLGRYSKSIRQAWLTYSASVLGLFTLLFFLGCNPKVCYNAGVDGLEPLREISFFLTEGLALSTAGFARRGISKREYLLGYGFAFYAIAYYPVIFSVAGVRLVPQFSPLPVIFLVSMLSLAVSSRVLAKEEDQRVGFAVPILSFLLLAGASVGIASQYYTQVVQLMAVLLGCVAAASLLGVRGWWEGLRRLARSRALTVGLVALVLTMMVVIPPDAVNGTSPSGTTGSYTFRTPVLVAGFNSGPNIGTRGVSANFSFGGTNPSVIQQNNYLAAGIGVHSPNCCVDGLDYGYRADVFLYQNGNEIFTASGWEACDIITACGGHTWKHLLYFSSTAVNSSIGANFRLSMQWMGRTLDWFYSAGTKVRQVASFRAPGQENPGFDAGWLGLSSTPSPGGYPFFQFGVMSAFPIGRSGWRLVVSCPAIIKNSTWRCIDHAGLVQGDNSYWKFIWRWGENYPGVGATTTKDAKTIVFQYSQVSVHDFQSAW